MIKDHITLRGSLDVVLRDKNGNVRDHRVVRNLVVDAGLNLICDRLVGTSESVMSHMAVGTDSTAAAAGDTALGAQLSAREALDSAVVSGSAVTYVATFEAGKSTGAVSEAGIFNAASAGTMLCRTTFPVVNKAADDTLSITWTITLAAS